MKTQLLTLFVFFLIAGCSNNENSTTATSESVSARKTIILAVDGGGIKGIIPAIILDSIESRTGKPCYQLFDVIGGTSTGGIIAMGLTTPQPATNQPFSASMIIQIYEQDGANIFVYQGAGVEQNYAKYYASHQGKGIEPYLQQMLGSSVALTDAFKATAKLPFSRVRQAFTTSYIVNSGGNAVQSPEAGQDYGPYLFNWYDAARNQSDNYYVWEATRGTSAAPTYFPIANVGGGVAPRSQAAEKWVIDGGMMSNDPAVWGITEAFRTGIAQNLKDIIVVSIGTGMYPGSAGVGIQNNKGIITNDNGNWGLYEWILADDLKDLEGVKESSGIMIEIILDAVQMASDAQLQALQKSGLTYFRLEPTLAKSQSDMDNISPANIQSLIDTTRSYLSSLEGQAILSEVVAALKVN